MEPLDISILPSVLIGEYEREELDFIEERIKESVNQGATVVIIDIGANIGLYAVILGRHLKAKDTLIAIEPDPRNMVLLKSNILSAKMPPKLEVHEAAVSCDPKFMNLVLTNHGGLSHKLVGEKFQRDHFKTISVKTLSLDSLFKNLEIGAKVFCKVDVEGFEYDVINSGISSILEYKPDLLIEFGQTEESHLEMKWGKTLELLFENYAERLYFLDNKAIQVEYQEFLLLAGKANLGNLWLSEKSHAKF